MWIESEAHDLLHHCYADNTQRYFFCESSQTVETESSTYFARILRTEINLFVTQELKTRSFLDIELEAQIGERGFRVCNSSIQLVSINLP